MCSIFDGRDGRRRTPWDPGCGNFGNVGSRLPTGTDLVASEWPSLTIEPAEAHLGRNRPTEIATRGAGGARTAADPATCRLCLGCPAVRTAPYRHARMVAANAPAVSPTQARAIW